MSVVFQKEYELEAPPEFKIVISKKHKLEVREELPGLRSEKKVKRLKREFGFSTSKRFRCKKEVDGYVVYDGPTPAGYIKITIGVSKADDLFLDCCHKNPFFRAITKEDIGIPAKHFTCLVRKNPK